MRIILLKDLKDLGKKYEIKEVSDGYARNFLIPRKLALIANEENIRKINKIKELQEKERNEKINRLKKLAEEVKEITFDFYLRVGEKGEVFGSVDKNSLKKALEEKGIEFEEIILDKPLKSLGEHYVVLNLGEGIRINLKVLLKPLSQTSESRQN